MSVKIIYNNYVVLMYFVSINDVYLFLIFMRLNKSMYLTMMLVLNFFVLLKEISLKMRLS